MIPRQVAITEVWLDEQARFAEHYKPVERRLARGRLLIGLALLSTLIFAYSAKADSITDVSAYLQQNTALPFGSGVGDELAGNLLLAQSLAQYASAQSLLLSEQSVLKAVLLYVWPGGPACICSEQEEPGVYIQSRIAINPLASATLDPPSIDFGPKPVPEPSVLALLATLLLLACPYFYFRSRSESVSVLEKY